MITIRPATTDDAKRIYELNKSALGYDYPETDTKTRLAYILNQKRDKILVACEDDIVVGYIQGADYECTYMGSLKNIIALAVDERFRGLGIGRKLLLSVEEWAKEEHCSGIRLTSGFGREQAHEFYRHCGYFNRKDAKNFVKYFAE